jgi:hypothetical protein
MSHPFEFDTFGTNTQTLRRGVCNQKNTKQDSVGVALLMDGQSGPPPGRDLYLYDVGLRKAH